MTHYQTTQNFFKVLLLIASMHINQAFAGEIICLTTQHLHLLPLGKEVDGMEGDWLMKNDRVLVVIGAATPDREANQMVSSIQGAVIDYTTLQANNDQLVVYYPQGARVDVPSADTIKVIRQQGSQIGLQAIKYPTKAEPYTAITTYTLQDGEGYLQVETVYRNPSTDSLYIRASDQLRCDNKVEAVAPAGEGHVAYINNKWYQAAYGVATTPRKLYTKGTVMRKNLIKLGFEVFYTGEKGIGQDSVLLSPGKEIRYARILLTGTDVADIQKQASALQGITYQRLSVQLKDTQGNMVSDAFVEAHHAQGALLSAAITDSTGKANLYLRPGNILLEATKLGHDTLQSTLSIATDTSLVLTMQPITQISFTILDSSATTLPVKVAFHGVGGTPDPFLGPDTRSAGAGNLYYSNTQQFAVPLSPGTYRIIFSHGPEYQAVAKEIAVGRGANKAVAITMHRLFSTPHWIIADLHNHSTRSGDSNVGVKDRVINLAASGIEFAPATEHNRISTYTQAIQEAGLHKYLASAAGMELSGRPGPGAINHQNAFPLKMQHGKRGYGAPKTDADPFVQMSRLYAYDSSRFKLMQQNHPDIGWLYFDKNSDGKIDKGFGTKNITDVMEIRESMTLLPEAVHGGKTDNRVFYWLQMLNLGYKIYGTANSDSHSVGDANGAMFNYVYTCCDIPEQTDPIELAQQIKQGHVVISNGPFLDIRINQALPGEEISVEDSTVHITIKVATPNWAPVNTVEVLVNGRPDSTLFFSREQHAEMFQKTPFVVEQTLTKKLATDAHIIVMVYGENENVSMVTGGNMGQKLPIAIANPVFVDIDHNGFKPNKDLLDKPLPTHLAAQKDREK